MNTQKKRILKILLLAAVFLPSIAAAAVDCRQPVKYLIGDKDNFHPGDLVDTPFQSQLVRDLIASRAPEDNDVALDAGGVNRPVGLTHYFSIPQNAQFVNAHIELRFKGSGYESVYNDGILYSTPEFPAIALKDLLGFEPQNNETYTVNIDLSHVPVRTGGDAGPGGHFTGGPDEYRNLLPELSDGQFDMMFVDDVTIDYSELTLNFECINIISDDTWKSYDSLQPGWETPDFDDSNWRNTYAPYQLASLTDQPAHWIPGTNAEYMWDYPAADIPSGMDGPDEAWFRKHFNISVDPSNIINATAFVVADDDFDFYVNGTKVHEDWDGVIDFDNVPYVIDIKPYLVQGENVLAMYAKDSYGIYEWALVDATIEFASSKEVPVDFFVSVEDGGTALYYYPVTGPNTFGDKVLVDSNVEIERAGRGEVWVELADFNSDGRSDILLMKSADEASIYYQNTGMVFSKTTVNLDSAIAPYVGYKPEAGDFNNDGRQDFAYTAFNSSGSADASVVIGLNQGGSNFTFHKYEIPGSSRYSVNSGDFDGDGNLDLLGQGYEGGKVYLHAGKGDGSFENPTVVFENVSPERIKLAAAKPVVADLNDDGKLDFIVGGDDDGDPGQAYLFLGDGYGDFTYEGEVYDSKPGVESGGNVWSHYSNNAYDFDGDGDKDVLLLLMRWSGNAPGPDGDLLVMENQGGGVFGGPTAVDGMNNLVAFVGPGYGDGENNPLHAMLDAWIDNRYNGATPQALIQAIEAAGLDMSDVEALLLKGRSEYPDAPQSAGQITTGIPVDAQHVDHSSEYLMYVPSNYDKTTQTPLIVVGHGGSSCRDLGWVESKAALPGIKAWVDFAEQHGFLMVAPLTDRGWGAIGYSIIFSTLSQVKRDYNIDPNRIYITGHSMGGHLSYRSGIYLADRWAAISPMSGGYDYVESGLVENLFNIPGFATWGENEPYEIDDSNRKIRDWMENHGFPWKNWEKPGGGHSIFSDYIDDVGIFFLANTRNLYPQAVFAGAGPWGAPGGLNIPDLKFDTADPHKSCWDINNTWDIERPIPASTFHWLRLSPAENENIVQRVAAVNKGNNLFDITSENARELRLYLHPNMVDFTNPIVVEVNGETVFNEMVEPDLASMLNLVREFDDRGRIFYAAIDIVIETDLPPDEPCIDLPGDYNEDGCVDRGDLNALLKVIRNQESPDPSLNYDLNGDGAVNIADARYLTTLFTNPRGASCQ